MPAETIYFRIEKYVGLNEGNVLTKICKIN